MKINAISGTPANSRLALAAVIVQLTAGVALSGEEGPWQSGVETDLDIPGDTSKYYGQNRNQYRDIGRRLAKIDLDADFNYDGVIDNDDPADNGAFQQTPPGLVVGKGELSKLVIRLRPYHLDFKGRAVVSLSVNGINRAHKTGKFASFEEEQTSVGHVKVWKDASRKELILDSRDPARRVFEWSIDDAKYPANVPGIVPRTLYVEGVNTSGAYSGDVRLLLLVQHRAPGDPIYNGGAKGGLGSKGGLGAKDSLPADNGPSKPVTIKRFRTSYDHILVTVQGKPHAKEFVDNNSSGVWK